MSKDNGAANSFNRQLVIAACKDAITWIEKERTERIEKLLAPLMEPRKKYWLFGSSAARTREEAKESAGKWELLFAETAYDSVYKTLTEILAVAQACNRIEIQLTRHEFSLIASGYKVASQGDVASAA